ncbi:FKBP-type peptidyl-prolyl cis-trans isomerase [bacterium]|nr:FKBP-type peptidyl-prolyl cis-trans isomerase [bacterium]
MGDSFLDKNAEQPDVIKTRSGLQYRVIKEGKGRYARASDTVTVHYEGQLTDGTVFDSSYKRGKPAKFKASGVIKGWSEALQMMNKGSVWELFIPPELAYGSKGIPNIIPPNAVLIFTVELIKPRSGLFG